MDIRKAICKEHTKDQAQMIADYAINNPESLNELMECFFDDHFRICQRAAWPVGIIGQQHAHVLMPFLSEMVRNLDNPKHDAVIRNTIRTLQYVDIPEDLQGEVYEKCFIYLIGHKYPTAIKAFSSTVLVNIAMELPELKEELIIAIEEQIPFTTVGFVNRAKKLLLKLKKE